MTAKWWGKTATTGEKAAEPAIGDQSDNKDSPNRVSGSGIATPPSVNVPATVEMAKSAPPVPTMDKAPAVAHSAPGTRTSVTAPAPARAVTPPTATAVADNPAILATGEKPVSAIPEKPVTATIEKPAAGHDKRKALGRGLDSLLPGPRVVAPTAGTGALTPAAAPAPVGGVIAELHGQAAPRRVAADHEVLDIDVELIDKNPHQTRTFTIYEEQTLPELAESIKVQGVIQPITARPGKDGRYILIAGERRLRASKMAGRKTIPAIVRMVSDQQAAEMTVIENLQRQDLTCIDLARAYAKLSRDFGMTQEQIGQRVGVSRESVSNHMRLLKLPEGVQFHLETGELEFSHARALLNLGDPELIGKVAHKAVTEHMSVDDLERFILFDKSMAGVQKPPTRRAARWVDPNVRAAQRKLEEILGVRVTIRDRQGKGKITLQYSTLEDFDRVLGMLTGKKGSGLRS